jgi:hypothetical protein
MRKRSLDEQALTTRLTGLLHEKRFKAARSILRKELVRGDSLSKHDHRLLLSSLVMVEVGAKKPQQALEALARRRALGFSHWKEKLDASFQVTTLLVESEDWFLAREELCSLINDEHFLDWEFSLPAMERYFQIEEECKKQVELIFKNAFKAVLKRYEIRSSQNAESETIEESVRDVSAAYHRASQSYQELFLRAYSPATDEGRAVLIHDLEQFASTERVGFFSRQAKSLLTRLIANPNSGSGKRRSHR